MSGFSPASTVLVRVDGVAPTPAIGSAVSNSTNGAFGATIAFGETVSGFELADITAGNATLSGLIDNGGGNYSVTVTPVSDGLVSLNVAVPSTVGSFPPGRHVIAWSANPGERDSHRDRNGYRSQPDRQP